MRSFKQAVVSFIREEEGLTVVEYAIAGGLVGLGVVTAFTDLGKEVAEVIKGLTDVLDKRGTTSTPSTP